jgi:multidrug efflux pump subunit AcrA (membrane-fusion protein)
VKSGSLSILIVFSLLSAAGSASCSSGEAGQEQGFTKEMALSKKKVEIADVKRLSFERVVRSSGSLEPRHEASLRALVSGPLVAIHVDIGDRVSPGQVLCETRPIESKLALRSAEAALDTARANLSDLLAWQRNEEIQILKAEVTRASAEYERLAKDSQRATSVFERGAISESELQAARTAAESAKALLEVAQERLRVAESGPTEEEIEIARGRVKETEAAVARARQNLADTRLRAPYAAVITRRSLKTGDYANRGDPVLELADISYLEAETRVPERYARQIETGIPVIVRVDTLGVERKGEVVAVSGAIEPATRSFLVKVGIDNADHFLKAGVFCTCDFQLPPLQDALAVPHVAVQHIEGSSYVWVEEAGRVHRVNVTLGVRNDGYVQVLGGLDGHERVVIAGAGALSENDEVASIHSS